MKFKSYNTDEIITNSGNSFTKTEFMPTKLSQVYQNTFILESFVCIFLRIRRNPGACFYSLVPYRGDLDGL